MTFQFEIRGIVTKTCNDIVKTITSPISKMKIIWENNMNFDLLLQKLFFLTRVKVGDIAKTLKYDRTIVSKWKNGRRIPSEKNSSYIFSVMAQVFAEAIIDNGLEDNLLALCQIKVPLRNQAEVQRTIVGLFERSYYQSQSQFVLENEKQVKDSEEESNGETRIIMDLNQMRETLYADFTKLLASTSKDLNIYSTISVNDLVFLMNKFVSKINFVEKRTITFHIAIDKQQLMQMKENDFYVFAVEFLKSSYFEIKAYIYEDMFLDEFLYFKDVALGWLTYSKTGLFSLNITTLKDQYDLIFKKNSKIFDDKFQIVKQSFMAPDDNEWSKETPKGIKIIFSGFFSSYFFPSDFATNFLTRDISLIDASYEEFEKIFFKNEIYAIITKTAVKHFIKTGRIQVGGKMVVLPMKYRIYILKRALIVLSAKPKVNIYLLDDENDLGINEINVSFLMTDESLSFFKDLETASNPSGKRYAIVQPELVDAFLDIVPNIIHQLEPFRLRTNELVILGHIIKWLENVPESVATKLFNTFFENLFRK